MTDKQPEALRLAYIIEGNWDRQYGKQIAAELRRLHEVNAELVDALRELLFEEETQDNGLTEAVIMSHDEFVKFMSESVRSYESAKEKARAAITKATGEQQ
jgi:uncharacterized UPF0160 family protein